MVVIELLSELIDDELCDAEKYINLAFEHKIDHPDMAKMFCELAKGELEHKTMLHRKTVDYINTYKEKHGEPPKEMLAIYNYLHNRHVSKATEIIVMLKEFSED